MVESEMLAPRGTAILVLGMHRSGTSMLTRALHAHGCALSKELLGANSSNPSGHWESKVAIDIDDQMLHGLGRSWDDLRDLPDGWLSSDDALAAKQKIKILVNEDFRDEALWVIKEPRMCRLAPLWIDAISEMGFQVKVVIAIRPAPEVALSLLRRDGIPTSDGLLLWMHHLLEAERATRAIPRVVVSHREITRDWRTAMRRIASTLQLQWPIAEHLAKDTLDDLISEENVSISPWLARETEGGFKVPEICVELYESMLATRVDDQAMSRVIALSEQFDVSSLLYAPVVRSLYRGTEALKRKVSEVESSLAAAVHSAEVLNGYGYALHEISEKLAVFQQVRSALTEQLDDLRRENAERVAVLDGALAVRSDENARLIAELDDTRLALATRNDDMARISAELDESGAEIARLSLQAAERQKQLVEMELQGHELQKRLLSQQHLASQLETQLADLRMSQSWRFTAPVRIALHYLRRGLNRMLNPARATVFLAANPHVVGPVVAKARQEGPLKTLRRLVAFSSRGGPRDQVVPAGPPRLMLRDQEHAVVVLTTPHCQYLAHAIAAALERAGIPAKIIQSEPEAGFDDVPHFVICPQMFEKLPDMYVAFQMEQSVSSRWFTADYLRTLENSFAILDYSTHNIRYLNDSGLSLKQINYVPVGYVPGYAPSTPVDEDYDVVFYGDVNNERRQEFLQALGARFKVKVIGNLFGEELKRELSRARLIVNIHYYPGALLETTRIWECLSLDKLVVSEQSVDMDQHGELEGLVDFVGIGKIGEMVDRVAFWLDNEGLRRERVASNRKHLAEGGGRFEYFFYRFLLATDNLSFDDFWNLAGSRLRLPVDRICLNLPEYTARTDDFQKGNQYGFWCFPGLRHSQGWLGCAMSYKLMIMLARQQGMPTISICEDDVDFTEDFEQKLEKVHEYLGELGNGWDVFSGLMADFNPQARISAVADRDGLRYVHTDKLISTVFNVYSENVFDIVAGWDESNLEVKSNTIDRYLEGRSQLRVVTTDPFLVGHKEDHHSTIWGFKNTQYNDLINSSNEMLRTKVARFMSSAT